jgi:hypothetical protein
MTRSVILLRNSACAIADEQQRTAGVHLDRRTSNRTKSTGHDPWLIDLFMIKKFGIYTWTRSSLGNDTSCAVRSSDYTRADMMSRWDSEGHCGKKNVPRRNLLSVFG